MSRQNSLLAPTTLLGVPDPSAASEVRRFAHEAALQLGFGELRSGRVALVATELATNLARHARDGAVLVRAAHHDGAGVLDLLAIDRGPGMRDVARCMEDGYSTKAGGAGTGLGAIRRLADTFDIHSVPDLGTAVLARFREGPPESLPMDVGALSLPYPGEAVCGDAWEVELNIESCSFAVIDGLGHGVDAAAAAREAVRVLADPRQRTVEQLLEIAHGALRPTRGAAMAIAEVHPASRHIRYGGVGNIVGATATATDLKRMVSLDGTVGHETRSIKTFDYPLEAGQLLIMHSDGLRSHWRLERYPGLTLRDPFLIAGVLYRDYFKGQDDVTVVVARAAEP